MKNLLKLSVLLVIVSCISASCPEGINLLPRYGYKKKCAEQLAFDSEFLAECDKKFPNRKEAALYYVGAGWSYFGKNDLNTAMKRFNQAWLLDSTNAEVYSGFGQVTGMKGQFKSSIVELEKSLSIDSNNPKALQSIATSYGQYFFQTKDETYLQKCIASLKRCVRIEPNNARAFGQLTGAYSYMVQKDSARKYLLITDRINPADVNPEVRQMLK